MIEKLRKPGELAVQIRWGHQPQTPWSVEQTGNDLGQLELHVSLVGLKLGHDDVLRANCHH
jgi:hypothetical protein